MTEKRCPTCGETKPMDDFASLSRAKDGRQYRCRACSAAANGGRYARNKEKPKVEPKPKRCPRCGEVKDPSGFYKNAGARDGLSGYCRPCWSTYSRGKEDKAKKAQRTRAWRLNATYGLTVQQYDDMLAAQGGGCAICRNTEKLHIDHCHDSGLVRGILCENCNRGLGMFADDIDRLAAAREYIERSRG